MKSQLETTMLRQSLRKKLLKITRNSRMERTYSIIKQEAFEHFHHKFKSYRSDMFAYINIVTAATKPIPIIDKVTTTETSEVTTTTSIDEVTNTETTSTSTSVTTTTSTEMQYAEPIPHIIDEGQNEVEFWLQYPIIRTSYINALRKQLKMEPMTEHEQQIMHFVDIEGHWKL